MVRKLLVTFVCATAMILSAAESHQFTLWREATLQGKNLKAGDYKLEMKGDVAVLKHGKQTLEVPAHAETDTKKFYTTTVRYGADNELLEIGFGGSHTRIVFGASNTVAGVR